MVTTEIGQEPVSCSARPSNVCKMLPPPSAELFLASSL